MEYEIYKRTETQSMSKICFFHQYCLTKRYRIQKLPVHGMQTSLFLQASKDGDQENAAANRGKILVLRRRIEELESQITQKNEELQKKVLFYMT